jgi:hypothetical protein
MLAFAALILLAAAPPAPPAEAKPPVRVSLWLTAKATGDRLASKEPVLFDPISKPEEHFPTVRVDPSKAFRR